MARNLLDHEANETINLNRLHATGFTIERSMFADRTYSCCLELLRCQEDPLKNRQSGQREETYTVLSSLRRPV